MKLFNHIYSELLVYWEIIVYLKGITGGKIFIIHLIVAHCTIFGIVHYFVIMCFFGSITQVNSVKNISLAFFQFIKT